MISTAFYEDVGAALERHPNVVIAVSEGLRCADGHYVGEGAQSGAADVFGHKYLSGTGKALELAVKGAFRLQGSLGRAEYPSALRVAYCITHRYHRSRSWSEKAAVSAAAAGESGKMMTLDRTSNDPYTCRAGMGEIDKIANLVRTVPDEYINERGNGITDEGTSLYPPAHRGRGDTALRARSARSHRDQKIKITTKISK